MDGSSPTAQGRHTPLWQPRILLVEDDANLMLLISMHMKDAGFWVHGVTSCRQACGVKPADFRLALVDYQLPDGDGLEILNHLRLAAPALPVVIMSGCDDSVLPDRARTLGARAFLRKPLHAADLDRALSHLEASRLVGEI